MRAPVLIAVMTAAMMLPAGASAASYTSRTVGAWRVSTSRDGSGCFAARTYDLPGDTTLLLGVDADGANHLSVLNANWSIRPAEKLKLDFALSTGGYSKHAAVGMAADGKQGFVTSFESKFPAYFAASRAIYVTRGKVPVARLDLSGSGAAVAELRRCVAGMRKGQAAGRQSDIPLDPFARERK